MPRSASALINPFTPKSDQVQMSPAASPVILHHSVDNLASHSLLRLKDDYCTNSHYLIYTFLFKKVGRMYFLSLGVKGLNFP